MRVIIFGVIGFFLSPNSIISQCSSNIDPGTNYSNWNYSLTVEENFNNARRWEEMKLNLTANCLGDLTAPSGGWASLSDAAITLYIHNAEREARGELPFHGVEVHLSAVSQAHSQWQIDNDVFSHGGDPSLGNGENYTKCPAGSCGNSLVGSSPFERMNKNAPLKNQYQSESENLAGIGGSGSFPNFVASSIFGFMYRDAGSAWGHRHNILLTYTNDWGSPVSEGFIGVGIAETPVGDNFISCNFSCATVSYFKVLTVDYYDPQASATGFSFSVLPIELLSFDAFEKDGDALLNWTTLSERNSDYFDIQRSMDGKNFETIGTVAAMGHSDKATNYSYRDDQVEGGQLYYRLKEVDFDGKTQFSQIATINILPQISIDIFPNPFSEEVNIRFNQPVPGEYELVVRNVNGAVIRQITMQGGVTPQSLDLADLRSGVYFINVYAPGIEQTFRIVRME